MPKQVDPQSRREQVADAVLDELVEHGVGSVTLSSISKRTGLAVGSIRHFFVGFDDVLKFTLDTLLQRIAERAATLDLKGASPEELLTEVITFAAPTSDVERKETIAYVAYAERARTDPKLSESITATKTSGEGALLGLLTQILHDREVPEGNLRQEALLLGALIEGFTYGGTQKEEPYDSDEVRTIVRRCVDRIRDSYPVIQ